MLLIFRAYQTNQGVIKMLTDFILESDNAVVDPRNVQIKVSKKAEKYFGTSITEEEIGSALLHFGEKFLSALQDKGKNYVCIYNEDSKCGCNLIIDNHDRKAGLFAYITSTFKVSNSRFKPATKYVIKLQSKNKGGRK